MLFKEKIKQARLKVGLSQEKAGKAINKSRGAIEGYEKGISSPNPDQLATLCKLFNTTPNDLLGFQCQKQNEEAEMCKIEICNKTIKAIKSDVIEIRKELRNTPINYNDKREQLKKSIIYAEEIIEDLEKENAAFIDKACNNNKKLLKALNNLLYEIVNSSVQYDYDDDFLNAVSLAQEAVKKVEE